ncbi:glycosyltransferase family 2 protein [Providencia alcalifaciens]|uniref:glycosyltransferase family 2 protein n=1 Tax=Providencia alcalifaciens TaxID=126385 RepID=UPI001CC69AE2|nr:glycosyltransferase family 2 protein [Providencia alcalifaciens]
MVTTENNKLVSIIMPCYNSERFIVESINSVLDQSYKFFELIIVNDASTDNSVSLISSYKDSRIVLINLEKNEGVSSARNKGLSIAKGDYIAFIDSDDIWISNKLEKQIELLNKDWDVICSNYSTFNLNGLVNTRYAPEIITYKDMLRSCFIGNLTGIYHAKKIGKFYQKNVGSEDYLMWLSVLKKAEKAYCIQEPLAKYRIHETSLSSNKVKSINWQWNIYRKELKLNFIQSFYYLCCYIFHALKKRI